MSDLSPTASAAVVVVIDANVLIQSPRLSSAAWRAALQAQRAGVLALRIPEVCVIEAAAWLRREMPGRVKRFRRAMADLEQVGVRLHHDPWLADPLSVDHLANEATGGYEAYLRDRLGSAAILPISEVEHSELVRRAAYRVRPFNEAGAGYRDALIWEAVCRQAADQTVIFVTNNTRDFADQAKLALALQDDLFRRGLTPDSVTLATSLLDIVQAYAPEAVDAREVAERFLASPDARRQLERDFAAAFAQYEGIPYPAEPGELHPLLADPTIDALWDLADIEVTGVKPDGDTSYLIVGTATGIGRAYARHENSTASDIAAAEAARDKGALDDSYQLGNDLVVVKHLPVVAEFAATFEPYGYVWNAGVMEIGPAPTAVQPE